MENYRGNSHREKEKNKEEKKVEKVVSGAVRTKKRSMLSDSFISEDVNNVKSYIILDVLIPAAKKAISDIIVNGVDMLLYGETGHTKKNGSSKVSYRSYYDRPSERRDTRSIGGYRYNDIVLDNRGEAEDVLMRMDDLIASYGVVSVADLYDLVGENCNYTDNNYGWTDIRSASVVRVRDGYLIKLPKALPID